MRIPRGTGADLQAVYELAEDNIDLLQTRVAERLDVSRPAVSEMIRRLVEVSLVHLDGRTVSLTPAGTEHATAVLPRHRLAERFLTDVLETEFGEAHRESGRWDHVISTSVEPTLGRSLNHHTTCPHANPNARSGYVERVMVTLSEAPVGERVHVERIPDRLEIIAGLLDQLERDGLVRGLTVTVIARREDNATLVRTGRGELWVDADVCALLLVTLGDIDRITDELRCRGETSSAHAPPIGAPTGDAR